MSFIRVRNYVLHLQAGGGVGVTLPGHVVNVYYAAAAMNDPPLFDPDWLEAYKRERARMMEEME